MHFTPTGASWLNLVERWFALLTQKQIRRGVHRSTRALETAIMQYIAIGNECLDQDRRRDPREPRTFLPANL
jgi:hypothetical protein